MKFIIDGKFLVGKCWEALFTEFANFMYLNCLYKARDNISVVTLFFTTEIRDAETILKIKKIVSESGTIKVKKLATNTLPA